ncbi:MAG: hypothetical protein ACOYYS_08180 [Chloroflexota bacterium]
MSDTQPVQIQPAEVRPAAPAISVPIPAPKTFFIEYRSLEQARPSGTGAAWQVFLPFGLIWTCISLIVVPIFIATFWFQDSYVIARQPLTTTGAVTALKMEMIDEGIEPVVYYQFTARQDGISTIFEDWDSISSAYYDELVVGQKIEIIYAADEPSASAAAAEFTAPSINDVLLLIGVAIIFALVGLGMLFAGVSARLSAALMRN